jgi:hypothetical protein
LAVQDAQSAILWAALQTSQDATQLLIDTRRVRDRLIRAESDENCAGTSQSVAKLRADGGVSGSGSGSKLRSAELVCSAKSVL